MHIMHNLTLWLALRAPWRDATQLCEQADVRASEPRGARSAILVYLLYILNLPKLPMTTEQKTPNMGKIQAKCDQTAKSVAGYKWSRKVAIFGMVKEKGLT